METITVKLRRQILYYLNVQFKTTDWKLQPINVNYFAVKISNYLFQITNINVNAST